MGTTAQQGPCLVQGTINIDKEGQERRIQRGPLPMGTSSFAVYGLAVCLTSQIGQTAIFVLLNRTGSTLITLSQPGSRLSPVAGKKMIVGTVHNQSRQCFGTREGFEVNPPEPGSTRRHRCWDMASLVQKGQREGNGSAVRMAGQINPLLINAPFFGNKPRDRTSGMTASERRRESA